MSARRLPKTDDAAALPPGHFRGTDGREYVSIKLPEHRVFARACCDALVKRGEAAPHRFLHWAKAVSVPADILDEARRSLRPDEIPQEHAE